MAIPQGYPLFAVDTTGEIGYPMRVVGWQMEGVSGYESYVPLLLTDDGQARPPERQSAGRLSFFDDYEDAKLTATEVNEAIKAKEFYAKRDVNAAGLPH